MAEALIQYEQDQELPSGMIIISPKTTGKLMVRNQRLLEFIPDAPLKPDTQYEITIPSMMTCPKTFTGFNLHLKP